MTYQVFRTAISSYQDQHFLKLEKEALEKLGEVQYHLRAPNLNEKDKCVIISNTHTRFDLISPELLQQTCLILHPNSGYDNISEQFISETKVPIILGNKIRSHAVVEYILSALLSRYCSIPNHFHWHDDRSWTRSLIKDSKIIILGHGEVGSLLTRSLEPLCHKLYVVDPKAQRLPQKANFAKKLTASILDQADVLIVCCSLSSSSRDAINLELLESMAENLLLINAARGEVIVEEDLKSYLKNHPSAFAYLDVFQREPFPSGFLSDVENINKTSHIAGVWKNLNEGIIQFEEEVLKEFLKASKNNKLKSFYQNNNYRILNTQHFS